jgi:putative ABC transport system substrate-binding protein
MRRREFIGLGVLIIASAASAQPRGKVYRIGILSPGPPQAQTSEQFVAFTRAMAGLGYVLGENLAIELRGAGGRLDRLPALVQELIDAKADVLVINGYPAAVAAKASGHPTVAAIGTGDAVLTGLVQSFAHPGGNITGISESAGELSTKRLGLLKELLPNLRQVAMLWNQDDLGMTLRYRASSEAAEKLGVRVQALGVRAPDEFEAAFAAMDADRPDAILMVADSLTNLNRQRVIDFARQRRMPAIYELHRPRRRLDVVRPEPFRALRTRRGSHGSDPSRREARRSAVRAADPLRLCVQSQDRQGNRAGAPAHAHCPCRRGRRVGKGLPRALAPAPNHPRHPASTHVGPRSGA